MHVYSQFSFEMKAFLHLSRYQTCMRSHCISQDHVCLGAATDYVKIRQPSNALIFHTLRWQNKEPHPDNLIALSPLRHLLARLLELIILDDVGKVSQMNQLLHIWRRILLKKRGEF